MDNIKDAWILSRWEVNRTGSEWCQMAIFGIISFNLRVMLPEFCLLVICNLVYGNTEYYSRRG